MEWLNYPCVSRKENTVSHSGFDGPWWIQRTQKQKHFEILREGTTV